MTIYGIELAIKPNGTSVTHAALVGALDGIHDSLMAYENTYSADIASSDGEVFLLLGVTVAEGESPGALFSAAIEPALGASGLDAAGVELIEMAPAKELALT